MKDLIRNIKYNRIQEEVISLLYLLDNPKYHIVNGDETYIYLDNVFILFQIYKDRILCDCDYIAKFLMGKHYYDNQKNRSYAYKTTEIVKIINEAIKLSNYSNYKIAIL